MRRPAPASQRAARPRRRSRAEVTRGCTSAGIIVAVRTRPGAAVERMIGAGRFRGGRDEVVDGRAGPRAARAVERACRHRPADRRRRRDRAARGGGPGIARRGRPPRARRARRGLGLDDGGRVRAQTHDRPDAAERRPPVLPERPRGERVRGRRFPAAPLRLADRRARRPPRLLRGVEPRGVPRALHERRPGGSGDRNRREPGVHAPPDPRRARVRLEPPPRRPALHARVVTTIGRPLRSLPALLVPALAVLAPPAESSSPEPLVVVRALDEAGRALPGIEVEARCPEGPRAHATTDDAGFAVLAGLPPCRLAVAAVPESPSVSLRLDRLETRAAWRQDDTLARALPPGGNAWSLLETAEPAAILDRIDGAGLHLGEPGRFSARGASWTQNGFSLDGVDITDPVRGGLPLVDPDLVALGRIDVVSGLAPVEQGEPGTALALVPRGPGPRWGGTFDVRGLSDSLQSSVSGDVPPIARFGSLVEADAAASGPLGSRLRMTLSGRLGHRKSLERDGTAELEARLVSGTGQLAYEPDERTSLGLLAYGQGVR